MRRDRRAAGMADRPHRTLPYRRRAARVRCAALARAAGAAPTRLPTPTHLRTLIRQTTKALRTPAPSCSPPSAGRMTRAGFGHPQASAGLVRTSAASCAGSRAGRRPDGSATDDCPGGLLNSEPIGHGIIAIPPLLSVL